MKLELHSRGSKILGTADVTQRWRRLKNTFGFCEESRLELPSNQILRVQISIYAWPNYRGIRISQFPEAYGRLTKDWGSCELRGHEGLRLDFDIATVRSCRLPRSGVPGIYEQPTELDRLDRLSIWLALLITISEKTFQDYPDIPEWDTQFLMGGRPGSSRQH